MLIEFYEAIFLYIYDRLGLLIQSKTFPNFLLIIFIWKEKKKKVNYWRFVECFVVARTSRSVGPFAPSSTSFALEEQKIVAAMLLNQNRVVSPGQKENLGQRSSKPLNWSTNQPANRSVSVGWPPVPEARAFPDENREIFIWVNHSGYYKLKENSRIESLSTLTTPNC